MENASKALVIAGSILITVLVISLGVFMFTKWRANVTEMASLDDQEVAAFNNRIIPYIGQGKSGSDVNALIGLVRSVNTKAIQDNDMVRVLTITYPASSGGKDEYGIETDASTGKRKITSTVSSTKVDITKRYNVGVTYSESGLISKIKVTQQ